MKKNKLVGLIIAVGGAVASIATASALYVKNMTSPIGFSIGDATWSEVTTGTIDYKINGAASGSIAATYLDASGAVIADAEGLGGEARQACYMFALSAVYNDGHPAQDFTVGKFTVSITNINAALKGNAKVWIDVQGYTDGTLGAYYYRSAFMDGDAIISSETSAIEKEAEIAASSTGAQSVRVLVKLNENALDDDATRMSIAEQSLCTLSVTWGAPVSFNFAHVVNNDDLWNEQDFYNMVPNVAFDKGGAGVGEGDFEWMYNGFTGHEQAKCRQGDKWSGNAGTESGNHELNPAHHYDVYWSGVNDAVASFQDQDA